MPNHRPGPRLYEFRVEGHLDHCWSGWFGGLTLTHHADGTTTLVGNVTDQSHLYGLLGKVRDLGATLISVNLVADLHPTPHHKEGPNERV